MKNQEQITTLLARITEDYTRFLTRGKGLQEGDDWAKERLEQFTDGLTVVKGSKYLRIETDRSVWGYVVNTDSDKLFKEGDILKAAGWNGPARNFARGNVMNDGYETRWTGA